MPAEMKAGVRVRFLLDNLGASERDDLGHVVAQTYGKGDVGILSFPHPNQRPRPHGCKGWWYVEVASRTEPGCKLYVGISPSMAEEIKEYECPACCTVYTAPGECLSCRDERRVRP